MIKTRYPIFSNNHIKPVLKVRKNARIRQDSLDKRNSVILEQKINFNKLAASISYGER
jgi:hypothetical protein